MEKTLEIVSRTTPLGIRFWDPVLDAPVTNGLTVTAIQSAGAGREFPATRTVSGIFAFHNLGVNPLPPLPENDGPSNDAIEYLVDVRDRALRFHDTRFRVEAPHRGLWRPTMAGSPAPDGSGALLLSAPARTPSAGVARVRSHLRDAATGGPASFALMEARVNGRLWYGMADREGALSVLFPYPMPEGSWTSPSTSDSIFSQVWALDLSVYYDPYLAAETPEDAPVEQGLVRSQPRARLIDHDPDSPFASPEALPISIQRDLHYGEDLVVRSGEDSNLYVVASDISP